MKLLNLGDEITESWRRAFTLSKGEGAAWRTTWGLRAAAGSVRWRQVRPACPRTWGNYGDMRAEGLEPLGEPGRTTDLAGNPKGRGYPNQARPGGIDRTEGREEMSARRTP